MRIRRRLFVDASVQSRSLVVSVLCSLYAVIMAAFLTNNAMRDVSSEFLVDPESANHAVFHMVLKNSLILGAVLVPSFWLLMLAATWRVAGPLYRIRAFLNEVIKGERVEPCTLRKKDKLQDICDLVNEVTEDSRRKAAQMDPKKVPEEVLEKTSAAVETDPEETDPEENPVREVVHLG